MASALALVPGAGFRAPLPGPGPPLRLLGAHWDSALTLVPARQGVHLDLGDPSRPDRGAAAGLKGPPGPC